MRQSLHVLVVDDSEYDAQLLMRELHAGGYQTSFIRVDSADAMRAALARQQWDLVVADYTMPAFSVHEALELVRASALDLPFIIVSGTLSEDVAVQVMKAGAHDYFMKGDLKRLSTSIERELREASVRREHRESQQRLRESEERFRQMAESIAEVFWMTDPDKGQMLYLSPAYEKIWGRSCGSVYANSHLWMEAIHPEDRGKVEAAVPLQDSGRYDQEYRIVRPDGLIRWIRDRAFPVTDASGRVYRIAGIAEDITEQKRNEQELRSAKDFSENLIRTANVIILGLDTEGNISLFNEAAAQITGYTAAELSGRNWFDILAPKARYPEVWAEFQRLRDGGVPQIFENPILTKTGTERYIAWRNTQVRVDGQIVATISFGNDITESKAASEALKQSEERLRMAIDAARMYTWEWDVKGDQLVRSGRHAEVHGLTSRSLCIADAVRPVHEDDRHRVERLLARSVRDGIPFRAEFRILRADRKVAWLSAQAEPLRNAAGETVRLIGVTNDITERKSAEAVIERAAYYDALTALPNRAKLSQSLQEAIRNDERQGGLICLLLLGLNNFKDINDTLGHESGDCVLKEVALRLQQVVAPPNIVARVGGDEFAILVFKPIHGDSVPSVIQRVQGLLHPPIMIDELPILVEAGIGIASYPENGLDADSLLRRADIAMYGAKKAGARYVIYEPKDDQYSPARLSLLAELRHAIERDELILHYQPKIDLKSGRMSGAEALVRWLHPKRGLVRPDMFIGLAERTGLIHLLTHWVLVKAVRQCGLWQKQGLKVPIAVNLSARCLFDPTFPDVIVQVLHDHDVSPEALTVEITESAIMADPARARELLLRIHQVGVSISIDDFGIGYSSLGYLRKLPVDGLKVDKSFVRNMAQDGADGMIVRSTIDLAHNLGLEVIAEGVETREVYDQLVTWGCDAAQGYWMSKPLSVPDFAEWHRSVTR
jgi:diguanylate cyclase (GGDEF)-like protein/PAS domain S-box-containing protein